jgi:hypothetical protein
LIPTKKADFNKLVTEGKIQDAIKTCCEVPDAGYRIDLNTAYIARKGQHEDLIKFINANLFLKNKAWMEKDKYEALVKSYTSASNEAKKSFSPEQQLIVFGKAGAIAEGKKGPIITFPNYVLSVAPGRKYGIFEGKPLALSLGSSFGKAKITDLKLTIQEGKTHGCWQLLGYKKSDDGTKVYQKVFNKYCETSRAMFGNYAGSDKTEYEKMGKYLNDRLTKAMQEGDNFNKFDANYEMEFSFVGMSKVEDQAVSNSFANIASDLNQMENSTQMEGLGGL